MPFRHPQTQVHVFDAPFTFLTPYRGRAESIPRLEKCRLIDLCPLARGLLL